MSFFKGLFNALPLGIALWLCIIGLARLVMRLAGWW